MLSTRLPRLICASQSMPSIKHLFFKRDIKTKYVPLAPHVMGNASQPEIELKNEDFIQLQRLSLLQFKNNESEIKSLKETIQWARTLNNVNTEGVEPMVTVLEDTSLYLREDKVTDFGSTKDITSNAKVVFEDYFSAPPGNIVLSDD